MLALARLGSKGLVALSAALGAGRDTAPPNPPTPSPAVAPPPPAAPEAPKPGPAARQRFRLADSSGQVWESEDYASLHGYVLDVNRRFAASAPIYQPSYRYLAPAGCAGGRCPR